MPNLTAGSSSKSQTPTHSRSSSVLSQNIQQHAPLTPSGLREAHTLSHSPENTADSEIDETSQLPSKLEDDTPTIQGTSGTWSSSSRHGGVDGTDTDSYRNADQSTPLLAAVDERLQPDVATETTHLLERSVEYEHDCVHPGPCNHGTFSPHPLSRNGSFRSFMGLTSPKGILGSIAGSISGAHGGNGGNNGNKRSATARLAERHGIKHSRAMYELLTLGPGKGDCFA